jgi:hypothetical protein
MTRKTWPKQIGRSLQEIAKLEGNREITLTSCQRLATKYYSNSKGRTREEYAAWLWVNHAEELQDRRNI